VLLDFRDLPRSKRTQTIYNGAKNKLVVTYTELNKSKMNKMQWHFHPKIHIFVVSCYAKIYSSGLVKNKTLSDNLHSAACKQSHSRVRSKRSQSRLRAFRACSNRSERVFTNERDRALSELTNGYLTPLSARMSPNYFSNVPPMCLSERKCTESYISHG